MFKTRKRAGDVARQYNAFPAYMRPWVGSPAPQNKTKQKNQKDLSFQLERNLNTLHNISRPNKTHLQGTSEYTHSKNTLEASTMTKRNETKQKPKPKNKKKHFGILSYPESRIK